MKTTSRWLAIISSDVDLDALYAHLAPHVHDVHHSVKSRARKPSPLPDNVKLPKAFYSHAVDTNAFGYIALPQCYWESFDSNGNLYIKGLGTISHAMPRPDHRVRRVRYLALKGGVWHASCECVSIAQERASRAAARYNALPTEFTLTQLNHMQVQELRNMMTHMNYWQSYFRLSVHGDPVTRSKGRIETWALKLIETTRIDGRRYPFYPTTANALRRMMQPHYFGQGGVKTLIFEDDEGVAGRTVQLGAAGSVELETAPPKGMYMFEVDFDKDVEVFFATFKPKATICKS